MSEATTYMVAAAPISTAPAHHHPALPVAVGEVAGRERYHQWHQREARGQEPQQRRVHAELDRPVRGRGAQQERGRLEEQCVRAQDRELVPSHRPTRVCMRSPVRLGVVRCKVANGVDHANDWRYVCAIPIHRWKGSS